MRVFCKAMHKHAELLQKPGGPDKSVCSACYMTCIKATAPDGPSFDAEVAFHEKHDFDQRNAGLGQSSEGTWASEDAINLQNVPKGRRSFWDPLPPGVISVRRTEEEREQEPGKVDMKTVMRGFRCIKPNKTRLPFWAPYKNWADLVCPHCSSSISQGITSGHHEMDGASPITLAMLRKEVPADDLRFAEPCPTRHIPNSIGQAGEIALKEATGHVERLLGHFTTQDFTSGNPDKRRALVNAINWLNDNK